MTVLASMLLLTLLPAGLASETKFDNLVSSKTFETGPSPAGYFLSTLDEICWLLNLRSTAGDVPDTPVFHAYLCVHAIT